MPRVVGWGFYFHKLVRPLYVEVLHTVQKCHSIVPETHKQMLTGEHQTEVVLPGPSQLRQILACWHRLTSLFSYRENVDIFQVLRPVIGSPNEVDVVANNVV